MRQQILNAERLAVSLARALVAARSGLAFCPLHSGMLLGSRRLSPVT